MYIKTKKYFSLLVLLLIINLVIFDSNVFAQSGGVAGGVRRLAARTAGIIDEAMEIARRNGGYSGLAGAFDQASVIDDIATIKRHPKAFALITYIKLRNGLMYGLKTFPDGSIKLAEFSDDVIDYAANKKPIVVSIRNTQKFVDAASNTPDEARMLTEKLGMKGYLRPNDNLDHYVSNSPIKEGPTLTTLKKKGSEIVGVSLARGVKTTSSTDYPADLVEGFLARNTDGSISYFQLKCGTAASTLDEVVEHAIRNSGQGCVYELKFSVSRNKIAKIFSWWRDGSKGITGNEPRHNRLRAVVKALFGSGNPILIAPIVLPYSVIGGLEQDRPGGSDFTIPPAPLPAVTPSPTPQIGGTTPGKGLVGNNQGGNNQGNGNNGGKGGGPGGGGTGPGRPNNKGNNEEIKIEIVSPDDGFGTAGGSSTYYVADKDFFTKPLIKTDQKTLTNGDGIIFSVSSEKLTDSVFDISIEVATGIKIDSQEADGKVSQFATLTDDDSIIKSYGIELTLYVSDVKDGQPVYTLLGNADLYNFIKENSEISNPEFDEGGFIQIEGEEGDFYNYSDVIPKEFVKSLLSSEYLTFSVKPLRSDKENRSAEAALVSPEIVNSIAAAEEDVLPSKNH